jgi:acyl-ACP thioesterase
MFQPPEIGQEVFYTIRTSEIDSNKVATVPSLLRLLHEAAMENVLRVKLSVWDLEPHNISWVLIRKTLKINRLPKLRERIRIVTYPVSFEKFFTFRDYRVYDEYGEMIASATSHWLLMDTKTRRMTRIPEFIMEYQKRIPERAHCLPMEKSKMPKFEKADYSKKFQVGWHDLDFNNHLSNVIYIQWMLEALEEGILQNKKPIEIELLYKMEGLWKDEISSEVQALEDGSFLHRLVRVSDGKELAFAQSQWR